MLESTVIIGIVGLQVVTIGMLLRVMFSFAQQFGALRAEMKEDLGNVKAEIATEFGDVKQGLGEVKAEIATELGDVKEGLGEVKGRLDAIYPARPETAAGAQGGSGRFESFG